MCHAQESERPIDTYPDRFDQELCSTSDRIALVGGAFSTFVLALFFSPEICFRTSLALPPPPPPGAVFQNRSTPFCLRLLRQSRVCLRGPSGCRLRCVVVSHQKGGALQLLSPLDFPPSPRKLRSCVCVCVCVCFRLIYFGDSPSDQGGTCTTPCSESRGLHLLSAFFCPIRTNRGHAGGSRCLHVFTLALCAFGVGRSIDLFCCLVQTQQADLLIV